MRSRPCPRKQTGEEEKSQQWVRSTGGSSHIAQCAAGVAVKGWALKLQAPSGPLGWRRRGAGIDELVTDYDYYTSIIGFRSGPRRVARRSTIVWRVQERAMYTSAGTCLHRCGTGSPGTGPGCGILRCRSDADGWWMIRYSRRHSPARRFSDDGSDSAPPTGCHDSCATCLRHSLRPAVAHQACRISFTPATRDNHNDNNHRTAPSHAALALRSLQRQSRADPASKGPLPFMQDVLHRRLRNRNPPHHHD